MPKRAVKKAARADDKRQVGTAQNPKKVAAPAAKPTGAPTTVATYKKKTPGGGAGRPRKVR